MTPVATLEARTLLDPAPGSVSTVAPGTLADTATEMFNAAADDLELDTGLRARLSRPECL